MSSRSRGRPSATAPGAATIDAHVIVVGGGPAGLSAAAELRRRGVARVTVFDREQQMGGVPRHTDHLGFGARDLHRALRGPAYARRLVGDAEQLGVHLRPATTVVHTAGTGVVLATGEQVDGDALVLATGVRERPRAARLVPGDRPAGVYTTGTIQQLTALHHRTVGTRAVIVGAEHVSFSAIWTLRHGGCEPVAMVTPLPRHQTYAPLRLATAARHRVPVITGVTVDEIIGRHRVQAVALSNGQRIACDTVVFTGEWVPEHELARGRGLVIAAGSGSPAVTAQFHSSATGVFAIGNLVHPAETADVCALDGRSVATAVAGWLSRGAWPATVAPIHVQAPVSWASHSSHGVTARVDEVVRGRLQLLVDGRAAGTTRHRLLVPHCAIIVRGEVPTGAHAEVRLVTR